MPNIGVTGLILILIVALLLFGPSKLPELGRAVGKTMKEFKQSVNGIVDEDQKDENKQGAQAQQSKQIDQESTAEQNQQTMNTKQS